MQQSDRIGILILAAAAILLAACRPEPILPTPVPDPGTVHPPYARVLHPDVAASDLDELTAGNTAFAFDLYQALRGEADNLFYSPYSISIALAMTFSGARGETETQMANVLHFTLPPQRLHPAFNALDLELAGRPAELDYLDESQRFEFNLANATWGQMDEPFLPEFLDTLALNYGAGMYLTDFVSNDEAARLEINDWVSAETRERINDLIPQGVLSPDTRLVLVNAVYFRAGWQTPFAEHLTHDLPFTLLDGTRVDVPMMSCAELQQRAYAAGDGWQAVSLPYAGGLAEMVILVPEEGRFEEFEAGLSAESYAGILDGMNIRTVSLTLPQFEFTSDFSLKETLPAMGMTDAFLPGLADLSGMNGIPYDLFIMDVIHKAFIGVDENGTEAAAATAVIVGRESAMVGEPALVLTIDRPFIFIIRDVPTGTVLFLGRVLDPTGGE
ncbi:MAG: serpin family protein [Anaerolineales bacterium]|nr:serpin family protein [Anaerolineales bacterium]